MQLHGFGKTFALPAVVSVFEQPVVEIFQRFAEFQKAQAGFRPFVQPLLQQIAFFIKCGSGFGYFIRHIVAQSFRKPEFCPFHAPGQAGVQIFRLQQFLF